MSESVKLRDKVLHARVLALSVTDEHARASLEALAAELEQQAADLERQEQDQCGPDQPTMPDMELGGAIGAALILI